MLDQAVQVLHGGPLPVTGPRSTLELLHSLLRRRPPQDLHTDGVVRGEPRRVLHPPEERQPGLRGRHPRVRPGLEEGGKAKNLDARVLLAPRVPSVVLRDSMHRVHPSPVHVVHEVRGLYQRRLPPLPLVRLAHSPHGVHHAHQRHVAASLSVGPAPRGEGVEEHGPGGLGGPEASTEGLAVGVGHGLHGMGVAASFPVEALLDVTVEAGVIRAVLVSRACSLS
mmetsp:Transcript_41745/g.109974  ORF Transcript_41745/g.109974 Transcript_41745/m.109974 type:complete len:224 (+) Transcript_41745:1628-2299(+)